MTTTLETVQKIVAECLGQEIGYVTPNIDIVDSLGADSLDVVEIVIECEKTFNVMVPDRDIEKIRSPNDAAVIIDQLLAKTKKLAPIGEELDD